MVMVGGDERRREADRAAASSGLYVARNGPAVAPRWAVARRLTARTTASMHIARAQQTAADADGALVEIDVFPLEAERLALTEAQREGYRPAGAVSMPAGDLQQLLDLMHFVRLNLLLRQR